MQLAPYWLETAPCHNIIEASPLPRHSDVVVVPRAAVRRQNAPAHVFRIIDNVAQKVEVVTSYEDDAIIVIEEGIESNDDVVVEGNSDLNDHDTVEIFHRVPLQRTLEVSARTGK